MKNARNTVILLVSALMAGLVPLNAASWMISPGQSLQAAIDAAAPGDNITVQSGGYDENITITKGLDIRGVGLVSVTGTLTITDTALPVYIADLNFGKTGATGITISGADQDIRMDRCTLALQGDFSMTGGEFYGYKNTFTNDVTFNGSDWTLQRSTVAGDVTVTGSNTSKFIKSSTKNFSHTGGECTIFQSDVQFNTLVDVRPESAKSWIAYSTLCYTDVFGASEIVGNHFVLNQYDQMKFAYKSGYVRCDTSAILRIANTGGKISIRNNVLDYLPLIEIESISLVSYEKQELEIRFVSRVGISISNGVGLTQISNNTIFSQGHVNAILSSVDPGALEVRNNVIDRGSYFASPRYFEYSGSSSLLDDSVVGFFQEDANFKVTLKKLLSDFARSFNMSSNMYKYITTTITLRSSEIYAINCQDAQSVVTHNLTEYPLTGGIQSGNKTGTISYANRDITASQPFFSTDADLVDRGSPELIYNDLDGSLNDIGAYGGHSYDPTGRTTTKPVILSGSVSPLYIKRGGSVTVDARAAVVAEP